MPMCLYEIWSEYNSSTNGKRLKKEKAENDLYYPNYNDDLKQALIESLYCIVMHVRYRNITSPTHVSASDIVVLQVQRLS